MKFISKLSTPGIMQVREIVFNFLNLNELRHQQWTNIILVAMAKALSTSKASKKEEEVLEKPSLGPIEIHFKIESIRNFQNFDEISEEFSVELLHSCKPIKSSDPDNLKFYASDDDSYVDLRTVGVIDLDIHYVLTVYPDSVEDIRMLTECPMFITLNVFKTEENLLQETEMDELAFGVRYEDVEVANLVHDRRNVKSTNEKFEKETIGYGYLDLVQIVKTEALDDYFDIYIHPETKFPSDKKPKISLHVYSVLGILQNTPVRFGNMLTCTMENIFNPTEFMINSSDPIRVEFALINPNNEDERQLLFQYSDGQFKTFEDGKMHKRWCGLPRVKALGTLTSYPINGSLKGIYVEEPLIFSDITYNSLVCNFDSIHRILLTGEDCLNLEDFINKNNRQISVEIFFGDEEYPKYIGYADLAPFLFPKVVQGRFCVGLKTFVKPIKPIVPASVKAPPTKKEKEAKFPLPGDNIPVTVKSTTKTSRGSKSGPEKKKEADTKSLKSISRESEYLSFCIFAVELLKPLTVRLTEEDYDTAKLISVPCRCEELPSIDIELLQKITTAEFEDEIITIMKDLPFCTEDVTVMTDDGMKIKCDKFKELDCYKKMRENLVEKITKYTAAKYGGQKPTQTNIEFVDLMTSVYNDLSARVEEVVNTYHSGSKNFLDMLEVAAIQNIRMFTAYEAWDMGFHYIAENVWDDIEAEADDDENVFIDLILKDLFIQKPESAERKLKRLFNLNPKNYYGLLINVYFIYRENESATELWIAPLMEICKKNSDEIECWALLYVMFYTFSYRAGYVHAKMKCENNYPPKEYPQFWNREHLYCDTNNDHENPFCYTIFIFCKLGLWIFADLLFEKFKHIFDDYNRKRLKCYILHQLKDKDDINKYFNLMSSSSTGEKGNKFLIDIFTANTKYESGNVFEAIRDYEVVYHHPDNEEFFLLIPYLRCAFWALDHGNFEDAKSYFWSCCKNANHSFLAWYGLGISLFRLKKFDEAEVAFSKASNIYGKVAELWIYMTMVNLGKKCYERAKECCHVSRRFTLHQQELEQEMNEIFRQEHIKMPTKF